MNNGSDHDSLRRELAAARAALARDAHAAVVDAHTLADWRYHFRAHPWLCCTGAAALGFLLVPARRQAAASATHFKSTNGHVAEPAAKGIAATLFGLGTTLLARQALSYATRRGHDWLELRSVAGREPPTSTPTSARGGSP
ncbi:MAG: hypothetical protein WD845_09525 [Pirellulales bacterium]